tara:strand:+ start:1336 stop:1938 length:603 start_codon:yes stop_codon:yes gene_type:complete
MIDNNMKRFISKKLDVSFDEAFRLQKKFYLEFGTTLFGLMKYYNVNPDEFLDFVHDIDLTKLKKSKSLKYRINNLPGTKILFTNGDEKYAKRVLESLGIEDSIDQIYDIKRANYLPKPKLETYLRLIKEFSINPQKTVFFEDIEKNLEPAHKLGITTVHIKENFNSSQINKSKEFVDLSFKCIDSALESIINNIYRRNNG